MESEINSTPQNTGPKKRRRSVSSSKSEQQETDVRTVQSQMKLDDPAIIDLTLRETELPPQGQVVIDLTLSEQESSEAEFQNIDDTSVHLLDNQFSMGDILSRIRQSSKLSKSRDHDQQSRQACGTTSKLDNNTTSPIKRQKPDEEEEENQNERESSVDDMESLRQWEWTRFGSQHVFGRSRCPGVDFTVMSYNVLSQNLLLDNMYLYYYSEEKYLEWDHRKRELLREITEQMPDILCLQEVNQDHYKTFFTPELNKLGYEGEYQKRTGSEKCDGCATFYNRQKFTVQKCTHLCYRREYGILDRDNVALLVKLRPITNGKILSDLCVANTHLLFNPRRGDVKLAQIILLLAELNKMTLTQTNSDQESHSPIILCGDFNLEPQSDLFKLLVQGFLNYEDLLIRTLSGQKGGRRGRDNYLTKGFFPSELNISEQCVYVSDQQVNTPSTQQNSNSASLDGSQTPEQKANFGTSTSEEVQSEGSNQEYSGYLWHPFDFVSTYRHTIQRLRNSQREVTTYHGADSAIVDFIFYNVDHRDIEIQGDKVIPRNIQEGRLKLLGRWGLMSKMELEDIGSFPCRHHPSDHLPLLTRFLLC